MKIFESFRFSLLTLLKKRSKINLDIEKGIRLREKRILDLEATDIRR